MLISNQTRSGEKRTEAKCAAGVFSGVLEDGVRVFRGIKYAEAGRWEYPKGILQYDGIYDASQFGSASFQLRAFEEDAKVNSFYHREFREGQSFTYSEDCLYLNIWAPPGSEGLPVVVYIHGGSFTGGCANENMINGRELCLRGVILVSFNYRLGPFGFASHPALSAETGEGKACGNFGLYDQLEALKWVKRNISGFGGDPEKITLMGQSAGAMSVSDHCLSPLGAGLFRAAVMMSGGGALSGFTAPLRPEKTREFWEKVCELAGAKDMDALRAADARTLFYAWSKARGEVKNSRLCTAPVVDGILIAEQPDAVERRGGAADIPYLIGVTRDDMIPIILRHFAVKWARRRAKAGGKPCWIYYFDRALPGDGSGAWHACDMLYIFGTLGKNWRPFTAADRRLSEAMCDMLAAFAKNGDPDCAALPEWAPRAHRVMELGEKFGMRRWPDFRLIKNTLVNKGPV